MKKHSMGIPQPTHQESITLAWRTFLTLIALIMLMVAVDLLHNWPVQKDEKAHRDVTFFAPM
jgi:hypothetical protein